jgi:hypothetical protein
MPEQIISASGTQYGLIVNPDGSLNVSSSAESINPDLVLQYSGIAIGSVWRLLNTGSFVKILSYDVDTLVAVSKWIEV